MLTTLTRWIKWVGEGKIGPTNAGLFLIALYCLFQALSLALISYLTATGASVDDAEQLIYLPYLWAGYGGSQPPLYTWMVWGFSHLLGANMLTLKVVKYIILFIGFFSINAALRSLGFSRLTASVGTFGFMTIPQIFWEAQHSITHTVAAIGFSALALLTFVHLLKARTTLAYILFGLGCALATLSKYNDVILLMAIVASGLSIREFRSAILDHRIFLTLAALIAALMPTILWNIEHPTVVMARTYKFGIQDESQSFLMLRTKGLVELLRAIFLFSGLTTAICAVAFAIERQNLFQKIESGSGEIFLRRALIFGLLIVVVLIVASGSTNVRNRWLTPLLILVPAYIGVRAEKLGPVGRKVQIHIIAAAIFISILVVPFTWYKQVTGGHGISRSARLDYAALYNDMLAYGPVRTIVGESMWIGNFRLIEPDLVLLNEEIPGFRSLLREPAVLVWTDSDEPDSTIVDVARRNGYEPAGQSKHVVVPEHFGDPDGQQVGFVRLQRIAGDTAQAPSSLEPQTEK